jgi:hypothetical protein
MRLPNVPEIGDILKFKSNFTFTANLSEHIEIPKGTLAKVIERRFSTEDWRDELDCDLVIAMIVGCEVKLFKFNYLVHQLIVEILEDTIALKLLYENKKKS